LSIRLKDLAVHLGLSVPTVSRALGGHGDISAQTRARVKAAAEKFGYVPATSALQLRTGRANAFGIVLPSGPNPLGDPFYTELVSGMAERAAAENFDVVLTVPPAGHDELDAYKRLVKSRRVDGVVIARTLVDDGRVDYLLEADFPFVTHGRTMHPKAHPWLDIDGHYGMLIAVRRLVRLGHHEIAYIGAPTNYMYAGHRLAGYREGLVEAGIASKRTWELVSDLTAEGTGPLVARLLAARARPSAILCATDAMAIGALKAIRASGLIPGRDVAVIGYGDLPFAEHADPPLTTVSRPIRDCGRRVIELIMEKLGGAPASKLHELWKPALVIRQSDSGMRDSGIG
jgi:LacI family transcriptional regulator